MYGSRARIGVIIPSTNTVVESEYNKMKPEGVSVHASRMYLTTTNAETLKGMAQQTERAAAELGTARCDAIVYGCTSGSFVGGASWEESLRQRMEAVANTKAITTSGAIVQALKAFGKKKLTVITPYIDELNVLEQDFLTKAGYEVLAIRGLGYDDNVTIGKQTPDITYDLAISTMVPGTELLVITCTDFRSIEIIPQLEKVLGIPVISSNLCGMWAAMRLCGVEDKIPELGSLFCL